MSLKKVILSTVAAATLSTGASAAVTVEADNVGNLLKFPIYYAIENANWSTKIRVTNVNTDRSIVAKLVIREATKSVEKLDILLYLSPTDVFDGVIHEVNGKVMLTTYDDSIDLDATDASGRVTATADGKGINIDLVTAITIDDDAQNSRYGYVEVYGLIENTNTDVYYGGAAGAELGVDLSKSGVNHANFVRAVIGNGTADQVDRKNAVAMTAGVGGVADSSALQPAWSQVSGGLTGEAVIIADNANGPLAMGYTAIALQDDVAGPTPAVFTALVDNETTPAYQRGIDTNFLAWTTGVTLIESIENALAKTTTYVTHYAKDGRNPSKDANVGNMAETTLIANFTTKKYSSEHAKYYGSPVYTYGINTAGGNLFWVEQRDTTATTSPSTDIVRRYAKYSATPHDHFEFATITVASGVSGSNPGEIIADKKCYEEVCSVNVADGSKFADGYIEYKFDGIANRLATATAAAAPWAAAPAANNNNAPSGPVTAMPYIPMVLTAVTTASGTNLVNIKYPAYAARTAGVDVSGADRVPANIGAYDNATKNTYDDITAHAQDYR